MSEWKALYLCEPADLKLSLVDRLALEYHVRCDEFDRLHYDGTPRTMHGLASVNLNSRRVFDDLLRENPEVSRSDLFRRINYYGHRYTSQGIAELWEATK